MPPEIDISYLRMFAGAMLFLLAVLFMMWGNESQTIQQIMMMLTGFLIGGELIARK